MSGEAQYKANKQIIGLDDKQAALVRQMKPALEKHADRMVDDFYRQLDTVDEARQLLDAKPERRDMLRSHLRKWLISLSDGSYSIQYRTQRYVIGQRHVEVGVEPWLVIAAMAFCRSMAMELVEAEYKFARNKVERALALSKVMDLDLNIMLQSYEDKRIELFLETTGFSRALFEQMIKSVY
ncbi:MAG: protoglobin domain-containing protein [Ardenticatenaceae bacterium]